MASDKNNNQLLKDKAAHLLQFSSDSDKVKALLDGKTVEEVIEEIRLYQAELEIQNEEIAAAYNNVEREKSHYQKLFQSSPFPMVVFSEKGVIQELNQAAMVALKTHYPTNRKKSIFQFVSQESGGEITLLLHRFSNTEEPAALSIDLKAPLVGQYECVLTYFGEKGVPSFLLIMRDVTSINQLTLQNQLLSKAVSETTAGIVITDSQRRVIWINNAFTVLSGYSLEELKGHSLRGFLHGPETDPETILELEVSLNSQRGVDLEILNYHRNGQPYWNNLIITPVFEDDELRYFVGVQHDITEKKALVESQMKMQRWETIGQISAGISHDFNNILGIISGYEQLISSINSQPELVPHLEKLKKGIDRASSVVGKLLKSSSGSSPMEKGELSVAISDTRELVSELFKSSLNIQWNVDPVVEQLVQVSDLQDVLLNLIINAKNASSDNGSVNISVSYKPNFNPENHKVITTPSESEKYVLISISDLGCGIDKSMLTTIFEPFNSQSKVKGTGMGLSMVLAFAKSNDYGLTIASQLNEGTTFSLWLPEAESDKNFNKLPKSTFNSTPKSLRVAILDDEKELTEITQAFLELNGHTAQVFHKPSELLKNIDDIIVQFDLLITDESMPSDIKGHNILEALKGRLPAILMSGYAEFEPLSPFKHLILQKPFTRQQLEKKISEILSGDNLSADPSNES